MMTWTEWFAANARGAIFTAALAGLSIGAGAYSWPLALIIPGVLVLVLLIGSQLRDAWAEDAKEREKRS